MKILFIPTIPLAVLIDDGQAEIFLVENVYLMIPTA